MPVETELVWKRLPALRPQPGEGRKATRKLDHEALAVIAQTGTTRETLSDLQLLVDTAQAFARVHVQSDAASLEAKRMEALRKIHAWLTAWSKMARTVVTRRDWLIRLGLAKRRMGKGRAKAVVGATPDLPPASRAA